MAAAEHLSETLRWRDGFGVRTLAARAAVIRREAETGKLRVSPCADRSGRPVLVITPGEIAARSEPNRAGYGRRIELESSVSPKQPSTTRRRAVWARGTFSPHLDEAPRASRRAVLVCAGLLRLTNLFYSRYYKSILF